MRTARRRVPAPPPPRTSEARADRPWAPPRRARTALRAGTAHAGRPRTQPIEARATPGRSPRATRNRGTKGRGPRVGVKTSRSTPKRGEGRRWRARSSVAAGSVRKSTAPARASAMAHRRGGEVGPGSPSQSSRSRRIRVEGRKGSARDGAREPPASAHAPWRSRERGRACRPRPASVRAGPVPTSGKRT